MDNHETGAGEATALARELRETLDLIDQSVATMTDADVEAALQDVLRRAGCGQLADGSGAAIPVREALQGVLEGGSSVQRVPVEAAPIPPVRTLLAAIDWALRTGSNMTNANLAMDLLCERLGVDRDRLKVDPVWSRPGASWTAPGSEGGS